VEQQQYSQQQKLILKQNATHQENKNQPKILGVYGERLGERDDSIGIFKIYFTINVYVYMWFSVTSGFDRNKHLYIMSKEESKYPPPRHHSFLLKKDNKHKP
jgi:hypothetical protein